MSGEIARILSELALAIESTYAQLAGLSSLTPPGRTSDIDVIDEQSMGNRGHSTIGAGSQSPMDVIPLEVLAIAQDLRETANAAMHSKPTLFWIEGLLSRIRALGSDEFGALVSIAEREIVSHYR